MDGKQQPTYSEVAHSSKIGSVQTHGQLEKEQKFSETITKLIPDWVFVVDIEHRRFDFHNLTFPVLGYDAAEAPSVFELLVKALHPEDRESSYQFLAQLKAAPPNAIVEKYFRLQHKDGRWMHFYERARVMSSNEAGEVATYLTVVQDITSIKETQLALQQSEAILKATINALPDLKFRLRKDGTYLDFFQSENEDIKSMTPRSQAVGNRIADIMPPQLAEVFMRSLQKSITERTVQVQEYQIDKLEQETEYREIRFSPINDEEAIAVVRDISERKRAEIALRESQERYYNFIKHSQEGIYYMNCGKPIPLHLTFDEMADVFYENAYIEECNIALADMYGLPMEAIKGRKVIEFHGGEHFEQNKNSFKDLIKNNFQVVNVETIEPDVNGDFHYYLNNGVGIIKDNHLQGFWGTQFDITERKRVQQREQVRTHILELLSKGASLDGILHAIVQGVESYNPKLICSILLLDEAKQRFHFNYSQKLPDFYTKAISQVDIGMGVGSCGTAAFTGERVIVEDIQTHPYWTDFKTLAQAADLQSCWSEPIKDSEGVVLGTFAIYQHRVSAPSEEDIELIKQAADLASITLHKFQAEAILKTNEEKFSSMVHNISDIITLLDKDGNIQYTSASVKHILGFDEQELIHKNVFNYFHPDDYDNLYKELDILLLNSDIGRLIEVRFLSKSGEYIYLEAQGNNQLHNPAIKGIIIISRDITARKKAEHALQESRSILRGIVNALPDLKFRVDQEGTFLDYYESEYENEMTFLPPSEFIGKTLFEALPSFVATVGMQSIQHAILHKKIQSFEYYIPFKDEIMYYEGRVSPVGETEAILTVRNISDRKKAQIELQEKLRELDEKNRQLTQYIESNFQLENFAYIASHDLREPVRTIHSFAQLLKRQYYNELKEDGKKCIDFIINGSVNMNRLIEDLLTFSRVTSEEHRLESIEIEPLLEEVTGGLAQFIHETNAEITCNELPNHIQANPTTMRQLLQNLLTNAIKFHHPERQPKIAVSGIDQGDHWLFEIKDNGIGIPEAMQDKIFQLFKKIHYMKEHFGTGIGLAICKRIVEQHGGDIWVESTADMGSSFYFTIKK